jgi:predicted AlkP superfamily pyrophosphatase or phosphodiesterase
MTTGGKGMKANRVVIIDVVGLTPDHLGMADRIPNLASLLRRGVVHEMKPVFPAVTLPVQASLTTGVYPDQHGVVANGFYFPEQFQVAFWEQASSLVRHERIWDRLRKKNPHLKSAVLFFQNSLYASCDAVITPRPLHTDEGLVQWCYSKPVGLYEGICEEIGEFNLMHYWGPMASIESSRWIAGAAVATMKRVQPHLMIIYLPHLDYCSQRFGPDHPIILKDLELVDQEVGRIIAGVEDLGLADETVFVVLSEYTFSAVHQDIPLNRVLRQEGLLEVRAIKGREYLDMELSPAFAMVDHQIAHVYVKDGYQAAVRKVLEGLEGIDFVLDSEGKQAHRIDHPASGQFVVVSARDHWFSYYWWEDREREPDFAPRIDIHRKPGYDPLELFVDPETFKISQNTSLIRGSHGYPPVADSDRVPFLVSGASVESIEVPDHMCVTDVAAVVEKILLKD